MTPKKLKKIIRAARGEIPADLVLKGGRVVNVFTCEIVETDVALAEGTIVGLGAYEGREVFDCRRRFIVPGFIDGHFHVESTLLTPAHLAPVLLPLGTTTLISDPHEIANVLGLEGMAFMLQDSAEPAPGILLDGPLLRPGHLFGNCGGCFGEKDLLPLRRHPRILGLGEMMNFPGVIRQDPAVLEKLIAFRKGIIDGHAPLLTGKDLCAYRAGGPRSDHECTRLSEAKEKLSLGLKIMIREGSLAKNLKDLLPLVMTCNARNFLLVTDDRHPDDLVREGHINYAAPAGHRPGPQSPVSRPDGHPERGRAFRSPASGGRGPRLPGRPDRFKNHRRHGSGGGLQAGNPGRPGRGIYRAVH